MKKIFGLVTLALFLVFGAIGCVGIDIVRDRAEPGPTSIGSFRAPNFGVVIDNNLQVLGVDAGSRAENAGVQIGDRIVKIREVTITSAKQARDVFRRSNFDQPIPFELERSGQTIALDVVLTAGAPRPNNLNISGPIPTPTAVPPDLFYF